MAPPRAARVFCLGLLATTCRPSSGEGQYLPDTLAEASLADDDECKTSADPEGCGFNALQLRAGRSKTEAAEEAKGAQGDAGPHWSFLIPTSAGGNFPDSAVMDDSKLGAQGITDPLKHYALPCNDACGGEGWCESYCGRGNACCHFQHTVKDECKQAIAFPVTIFPTCVQTRAKIGPDGGACVDKSASCSAWASLGECTKNPNYMLHECCGSCRQAPATTTTAPSESCSEDSMSSCRGWAANGECDRNPRFMNKYCCATCNAMRAPTLPPPTPAPVQTPPPISGGGGGDAVVDAQCSDSNPSCGAWASNGECRKNAVWMKDNCRLSCRVCILPDPSATTVAPAPAPGGGVAPEAGQVPKISATTTPVWATSDCQTATAGDASLKACYDGVRWVFTNGLTAHPDWFPGLTFASDFEAVQYKLHQDGRCPMPCAPSDEGCQNVQDGECFQAVQFAKNDGIYAHPEWFPELESTSSVNDFQMHLHNQNTTLCPKPCKR